MSFPPANLSRRQILQIAGLTTAALALFWGVRRLPTGTHLSHMDFRLTGPNLIESCDPANPAFIPVVAVRSPVEMRLLPDGPTAVGHESYFRLRLATTSGKTIGPRDLLVSHTEKLHLLIVDPSLRDYQHLHPAPTREEGTWTFVVTPHAAGNYRVFADFVPAATGRGLYAFADFAVPGVPNPPMENGATVTEREGYRWAIGMEPATLRAGRVARLRLTVEALASGQPVVLEPVMGASAHVVAFDLARSGFAHLHPLAVDPLVPLDPVHPQLDFQVQIPQAGTYVLWAQVRIGGRDRFAPFTAQVAP
jgi:hypothetical protein